MNIGFIVTLGEEAHRQGIEAVVTDLPQWFDVNARKNIPIDVRHQRVLVATSGDKVLGFVSFYVNEGAVVIAWLGVLREWHGKGVGRALVGALVQEAKRNGILAITTYTLGDSVRYEPYESTRRFYKALGFVVYMRTKTDNPGCPEELRLRLAIDA
jgi:GNAT superfamily N-acetyltransferase